MGKSHSGRSGCVRSAVRPGGASPTRSLVSGRPCRGAAHARHPRSARHLGLALGRSPARALRHGATLRGATRASSGPATPMPVREGGPRPAFWGTACATMNNASVCASQWRPRPGPGGGQPVAEVAAGGRAGVAGEPEAGMDGQVWSAPNEQCRQTGRSRGPVSAWAVASGSGRRYGGGRRSRSAGSSRRSRSTGSRSSGRCCTGCRPTGPCRSSSSAGWGTGRAACSGRSSASSSAWASARASGVGVGAVVGAAMTRRALGEGDGLATATARRSPMATHGRGLGAAELASTAAGSVAGRRSGVGRLEDGDGTRAIAVEPGAAAMTGRSMPPRCTTKPNEIPAESTRIRIAATGRLRHRRRPAGAFGSSSAAVPLRYRGQSACAAGGRRAPAGARTAGADPRSRRSGCRRRA